MIKLIYPWPPTVNQYWLLNRNGSRRLSPKAWDFRKQAVIVAQMAGIDLDTREPLRKPVRVSVKAYPPDRRKRDIDNILKALFDAMTHTLIWEDDSQVKDLHVTMMDVKGNGRVEVEVSEL